MCLLPYKKPGEIPVKLFETKTAHGKTGTAETLNQTPARFLLRFHLQRQGVLSNIF
jgi:hypothetical protein